MNNYKFKVRKISENTIEIKEQNHRKAVLQLMQLLAFADDEIFTKSEDVNISYEVLLKEIKNLNNQRKKKTEKNIGAFLGKSNEKNKEFNDNIEENFDKEYIEIVCDKCGNCIQVDEEDLFSD